MDLNKKRDAVENIKRLSVLFKGLLAYAEELERGAAAEQALDEVKRQLDALRIVIADAETQRDSIIAQITRAEEAFKIKIASADEQAEAIMRQADAKAFQIIDVAEKWASVARSEAEKVLADARDREQKANDRINPIDTQVEAKKAELVRLQAKIDAVKKGINDLAS